MTDDTRRDARSRAPHIDCDELHDSHEERRTRSAARSECDELQGDPALAAKAARQRGLVSAADLTAELARGAVHHRVERGRLHRVHRGVYLVGHPVAPELAREAAALLAIGEDGVLAREASALVQHFGAPYPGDVDVTVAGRRPRSRPGIRVHHVDAWHPSDVLIRRGLRVTSPTRTLLDLAGVLDDTGLERVARQAHVLGLYRRDAMLAAVLRSPGARGLRRLRRVLLLDDDPVLLRSRAERLMLDLVRDAGLPEPQCNVRIAGAERDFVWRAQRLIVEVDGWQFHGSRTAFEHDRRRDASAVAAGFRVMRVTWRRMRRERSALLADIVRALDAA